MPFSCHYVAAKETVTNEVEEPSSTVEDKDALQTKEEDADEPEEDNPDEKDETEAAEDPSEVESAEGEENDGEENDVELEDGGKYLSSGLAGVKWVGWGENGSC